MHSKRVKASRLRRGSPPVVAPPMMPPAASPVATLLLVALLALLLGATGCVFVGGDRPVGGWQAAPRSIDDDWRRLNLQELMAHTDTWFVVDEKMRGRVRGFANGAGEVAPDGGYFELAVISRRSTVPVQETVRVYFDKYTPVYVGGRSEGTVLDGLTGQKGFNVSGGGRVLEVPFHVNGGRLFAERVKVLEDSTPRVP